MLGRRETPVPEDRLTLAKNREHRRLEVVRQDVESGGPRIGAPHAGDGDDGDAFRNQRAPRVLTLGTRNRQWPVGIGHRWSGGSQTVEGTPFSGSLLLWASLPSNS